MLEAYGVKKKSRYTLRYVLCLLTVHGCTAQLAGPVPAASQSVAEMLVDFALKNAQKTKY